MKFKKLLQIVLPIVGAPLLAIPAVACTPKSSGIEITHADGTTSHYNTMEEALKDVRSGDSLSLQSDVELEESIDFKTLNGVTINGNGYMITNLDSSNSDAILSFENCTNIVLSNVTLCGSSQCGIYVNNGSIALIGVNSYGAFENVIYADGFASLELDGCILNTINIDKAINQTIYIGENTINANISSSYLDSIYVAKTDVSLPTINVKNNVYTRYIRAEKDVNFDALVNGWRNITNFIFGGYYDEESHLYRNLNNNTLYNGFYVHDAKGLFAFNAYYREHISIEEAIPTQLHLLNNVDCADETDATWIPLQTGDKWTTGKTQADLTRPYAITVFDGHNFTISNLKIVNDDVTSDSVGIFSIAGDNVTQNITFFNCNITVTDYQDVGLIYGRLVGHGTLSNVTIIGNGTKEDHANSSYIAGEKKVGSLVGIVNNNNSTRYLTAPEDRNMAKLTISGCNVKNTWVVNKSISTENEEAEIYLGGLVGWVAYHCDTDDDGKSTFGGTISINTDPNYTTYLTDIHFDWQQRETEPVHNFEIAILFLYSHVPATGAGRTQYKHCNSYQNVVVTYHGE